MDVKLENSIISNMIMSTEFLKKLIPFFKSDYLVSPFGRIVAKWCIDFFLKYKESPKGNIEDIFNSNKKGMDDENARLISMFLRNLSEEYEGKKINVEYEIDKAENYFKERSLIILKDRIGNALDSGNLLQAQAAVAAYHIPEKFEITGCDPLTDSDIIYEAFTEPEIFFKMPGVLGSMIGNIEPDFLVGIAAPYKRGKTWLLQEFAIHAFLQNLDVAFFSLEMPKKKMVNRIIKGLAALPEKPGKYLFPVWDCAKNQLDKCNKPERINDVKLTDDLENVPEFGSVNGYKPCDVCYPKRPYKTATWLEKRRLSGLDWKKALQFGHQSFENSLANIKLQSWPMYSIGLQAIKDTLKVWEGFGFLPSMIVVDYADLLKSEEKVEAERHRLDRIWKGLKALAQERHCIVVTATQTTRGAIDRRKLKQSDMAEDIRKLGHVDLLLGINQTEKEKERMISRIFLMVHRHEEFTGKECYVLQQLHCGQSCIDSRLV